MSKFSCKFTGFFGYLWRNRHRREKNGKARLVYGKSLYRTRVYDRIRNFNIECVIGSGIRILVVTSKWHITAVVSRMIRLSYGRNVHLFESQSEFTIESELDWWDQPMGVPYSNPISPWHSKMSKSCSTCEWWRPALVDVQTPGWAGIRRIGRFDEHILGRNFGVT